MLSVRLSIVSIKSTTEPVTLDDLGNLRRRIDNGYVYLLEHLGADHLFTSGMERWNAIVEEYRQALVAYRAQYSLVEIKDQRTSHQERLQRGWDLEWTHEIGEHFDKLIREYEALSDLVDNLQMVTDEMNSRARMLRVVRQQKKGKRA